MTRIYIHIPFCKKICSYCDYCKVFYNPKWSHDYLIKLKEEIEDFYDNRAIQSIYIGGGTPSCLSTKELDYLFYLCSNFKKIGKIEFTFECNLEDINKDLLKQLKSGGVNRLSIGIQSFNEHKLFLMGRDHNYEDASEKIKLCRELGFTNINLDLIYGFQNETLEDLEEDLDLFISLKPDHISTYSLLINPNTILFLNRIEPIDEDLDAEMYELIKRKLNRRKYQQYEVSNFALKTHESRHNLAYWDNEEYFGFGVSAAGYIDGVRYNNTKSLTKYLKGDYASERIILSQKDIMDYAIMLGLRKTKGIDINEFENKYQIKIKETYPIEPLLKSKQLIEKKGMIFINPDMLYLMNEILIKLV